jgi:ribonuclease J
MVFSSRIIPGNEKSVIEIQNLLAERGVKIITNVDCEIHASGHPSRDELERLYELVQPNALIPIHGGKLHLHRHAEIAKEYGIKNVLVPCDGDLINISEAGAKVVDNFYAGTLAVDGSKLIPVSGVVYKQREMLSKEGVVSVCLKRSKGTVKLHDFVCIGIFEESEHLEIADIRNDIASEIKVSLDGIIKDKTDTGKIKALTEKLVRSTFSDVRGKRPSVIVHVVD